MRKLAEGTGRAVAAMVGIERVFANVKTADRADYVRQLQAEGEVFYEAAAIDEADYVRQLQAEGVLGFFGNELVAQYRIRVGKRIGSAALIADGYHARTDGFTSLAVVVGAAGVWLGFTQADPLVGLVITVAILFVLKSALAQMWHRLMDAVEPELLHKAEETAGGVPGVVGVSLVRPRWIGHSVHAEASITVDRELSVAEGHRIAEDVESAMGKAVPKLGTVIVHVDPCAHDGSVPHEVGTGRVQAP